jgi:hypothetical protein
MLHQSFLPTLFYVWMTFLLRCCRRLIALRQSYLQLLTPPPHNASVSGGRCFAVRAAVYSLHYVRFED